MMAGLANNTTSLGEVFRRNIECFRQFSNPDIFDIGFLIDNKKFHFDFFPPFRGTIDHDVKLFHTTFHLYHALKRMAKPVDSRKSKKIGYFVWESSELNPRDADVLQDFDEIWTASEYCRNIFSQYRDPASIKLIPHPVPDTFKVYPKYDQFTILVMGNLSSSPERKNIAAALQVAGKVRAWDPGVHIILKTTSSTQEEWDTIHRIGSEHHAEVMDNYTSSDVVAEVIARSHILLSLHRSEGFGLTLAEAMMTETLPVCTGYSGNLDFVKNPALLVDYKLVDCTGEYFKGQWAEPDEDDAVDKIKHLMERGFDDILKDNRAFIRKHHSVAAISRIMQEALQS